MKKSSIYIYLSQRSPKRLAFVSLCLLLPFVAISLSAQEGSEEKQTGSAVGEESDVPNRLVEFSAPFQTDAKKAVWEFNEKVGADLRRLYVLVKNYGAEVAGAQEDFNSIQAKHKKALVRFYRRQNTWAWSLHKENHEKIQALYQKFMLKYKEQTLTLLAEVAEKLASAKLRQSTERGQRGLVVEPGRVYLKHLENSIRLRLAYQQNAIAREMEIRDLPQKAIEHYRLAKTFAIYTLRRMEKDPNRKKELETKYSKDMLDSRGLVANVEKQ